MILYTIVNHQSYCYTKQIMKESYWPVRINKYLADQGIASRREADLLIRHGLVTINDQIAKIGSKVNLGDKVIIDHNKVIKVKEYFAYHKPTGIATHSSEPKEKDIKKVLNLKRSFHPIGRLDKASSGLILITNDGRLTDRLLNPDQNHEKEYVVTVNKTVLPEIIKKLENGIRIENYKTKPAKAKKTGDKEITIILTEGKKHQIRRMMAACGYEVIRLVRTRIMNIKLDDIPVGSYRPLNQTERKVLLSSLSLSDDF